MRDMQMDKTELGCLRAIVLFNPGTAFLPLHLLSRPGCQPAWGTRVPGLSSQPHCSRALQRQRPAPSPSLGVSLTRGAHPCRLLPKALAKVGQGLRSRAHPLRFAEASGRAFGLCVQSEAPLAPASRAPEEMASSRASAAGVLEPGCFRGWMGTPGAGLGLLRASRGRCRELTGRWEDGAALGVAGPDSSPSTGSVLRAGRGGDGVRSWGAARCQGPVFPSFVPEPVALPAWEAEPCVSALPGGIPTEVVRGLAPGSGSPVGAQAWGCWAQKGGVQS